MLFRYRPFSSLSVTTVLINCCSCCSDIIFLMSSNNASQVLEDEDAVGDVVQLYYVRLCDFLQYFFIYYRSSPLTHPSHWMT